MFAAAGHWVLAFGSVGFVTTCADMLKGNFLVVFILVRPFLVTGIVVEVHADIFRLHEGPGDPVDGRLGLLLGSGPGRTRLGWVGRIAGLPGSVGLWDHDEPGPGSLQPFVDGGPGISPVELPVLPGHVDLEIGIQNIFVRIIERHCYQELQE